MSRTVLPLVSFAAGLLTVGVGLVHVFHHELRHEFCSGDDCVGPYLAWDGHNAVSVKDLNAKWRGVFSVRPTVLGEVWAPSLWGLATLVAHHNEASAILHNWPRLAVWHLLVALFGCFAFAGGFGILTGFLNVGVSVGCVVAHYLSGGAAAADIVGVDALAKVNAPQCTLSSLNISRLVRAADALSLAATLALFVVGATHLAANEIHKWCRSPPSDCLGPLLVWPSSDDFFDAVNVAGWGRTFSSSPDAFVDAWGAIIAALLTLLFPAESWWGLAMWHVFLAVFFAFGVAGNVGVLTGFFSVVVAGVVVVVALAAPPTSESGARYVLLR